MQRLFENISQQRSMSPDLEMPLIFSRVLWRKTQIGLSTIIQLFGVICAWSEGLIPNLFLDCT